MWFCAAKIELWPPFPRCCWHFNARPMNLQNNLFLELPKRRKSSYFIPKCIQLLKRPNKIDIHSDNKFASVLWDVPSRQLCGSCCLKQNLCSFYYFVHCRDQRLGKSQIHACENTSGTYRALNKVNKDEHDFIALLWTTKTECQLICQLWSPVLILIKPWCCIFVGTCIMSSILEAKSVLSMWNVPGQKN